MPAANQFRHQQYGLPDESQRIAYVCAESPPPVHSPEFRARMRRVAEQLRANQIHTIYLVHGTFVGPDAMGLLRELARLMPALATPLGALQKQAVQMLLEDAGNFTRPYADTLEQHLNAGLCLPIEVRLFEWTSENHHIGRADGAVRLLDDLFQRNAQRPGRFLLWGHSHGGNVFALLTNLLGSNPATIRRFFQAAQPYFRRLIGRRVDHPAWQRVADALLENSRPLQGSQLDVVTMGTPVRYGWDSEGYRRLLHFVHHRPAAGLPRFQARFPPTLDDVRSAANGDVVQWLGIAGTNFAPPFWSWRAWLAEIRLSRLIQEGIRGRDLLAHLQQGHRIHEEGTTVLVDYVNCAQREQQHGAGHTIYTRLPWMLFHLEQTVKQFYSTEIPQQERHDNGN